MEMTIETKKQIENTVWDMLKTAMFEDEISYIEIKSLEVFGSRLTGTHREDSDLDIKIKYINDEIKEYEVFNMLNDLELEYEGWKLDFFPIQVIENNDNNEEVDNVGITKMMDMYKNAWEDQDLDMYEGEMYEQYMEDLKNKQYKVSKEDAIKTLEKILYNTIDNDLEIKTVLYLLNIIKNNNNN